MKANRAAAAAQLSRVSPFANRMDPIPARSRVTMPYSHSWTVASDGTTARTVGTPVTYYINDTYAPGGGTGAHQPYGRDHFAALYNKFKVHSVKAVLTLHAQGENQNANVVYAWLRVPGETGSLQGQTMNTVHERPRCTFIPTSAWESTTRTFNVQFAPLVGLTNAQFETNIEDYAAAAAGSPTKSISLQIGAASPYSTAAQSTYYTLMLHMDVEWFERFSLGPS